MEIIKELLLHHSLLGVLSCSLTRPSCVLCEVEIGAANPAAHERVGPGDGLLAIKKPIMKSCGP